jgi:hypothetical protein
MNFIPLEYYSILYFQFLLIVVVFVYFNTIRYSLTDSISLKTRNSFGIFILVVTVLYLGLRPISFWFGDMGIYNINFQNYVQGAPFDAKKEFLFEGMMYFFAKFLNAELFFFTCAFLYVYLLYAATKTLFKDYWFYAFLMLIVAFTFWAYGSNGIRNGLATSIFIYGISRTKKSSIILILLASYLVHKSMLIPILAYAISYFYSNTKVYLFFWLLSIPLSIAFGGFWEGFFLGLGAGEQKLDSYLGQFNQVSEGVKLNIGFRWDFLLYSLSGVFAGWYYIFKKNYQDVFYNKLFHTYLMTNAVWILIIRANYSNRFAFLSWFLLGLVLVYPLLKNQLFEKQHVLIGKIILGSFAFSYLMNIILNK